MVEATRPLSYEAEDIIERMTAKVGPDAVFGEVATSGERAVIPVARLSWGGGGGMGSGAMGTAETEAEEEAREGEGMGFGFGARARPVGYIELSPESVGYRPIIDWSMLAVIGAIVSGVFVIAMAATRRR